MEPPKAFSGAPDHAWQGLGQGHTRPFFRMLIKVTHTETCMGWPAQKLFLHRPAFQRLVFNLPPRPPPAQPAASLQNPIPSPSPSATTPPLEPAQRAAAQKRELVQKLEANLQAAVAGRDIPKLLEGVRPPALLFCHPSLAIHSVKALCTSWRPCGGGCPAARELVELLKGSARPDPRVIISAHFPVWSRTRKAVCGR